MVGIYSRNRAEWSIAEIALNSVSMAIVPLYDTLGPSAIQHILLQTELTIVICSEEKVEALLGDPKACSNITLIVLIGVITEDGRAMAEKSKIQVIDFEEVEQLGLKNPSEPHPPKPSDIYTICYTSGATDAAKGVLLTHCNFTSQVAATMWNLGNLIDHDDVHISYLPLAHVFERVIHQLVFVEGAAIGFYRGKVHQLFEDIEELRPTILPSVPRLFNRLYDKVMAQMNLLTGFRKQLFLRGWHTKKENLKRGIVKHPFWDTWVFSEVAKKFGGRIRIVLTGSAPITNDVLDFLRICFSCEVFEGYGQTECTAVATVTSKGDTFAGSVGPPTPCNELKFVDVPDLGYFSKDGAQPCGEICLRGPNITQGYFKEEEKTANAIDEDGWLHTGDIGEMLPNGCVKITDRKKNIFKLAQGEYISPEKVESVLSHQPLIEQIFVFGDSLKASVVAVVVLDHDEIMKWAEKELGGDITWEGILCHERTRQHVLQVLTDASEGELRGFEKVKNVYLASEPFTPENELLTPTMKLRRPQLRERYKLQLEEMYANLQ
eukprot:TRINITY_DN9303_c0_g1_i1.p1 TRINITY_DN9303_c0_g1~~TRINITY_DN9303_c0_g1_i1.p1  ORF type:complete len:549 (+),score=78.51 TRINITY_DN9303_c0_g1_i1:199-1845(+)